jgi:hypothetical protein
MSKQEAGYLQRPVSFARMLILAVYPGFSFRRGRGWVVANADLLRSCFIVGLVYILACSKTFERLIVVSQNTHGIVRTRYLASELSRWNGVHETSKSEVIGCLAPHMPDYTSSYSLMIFRATKVTQKSESAVRK